jgi:hypothetical protein
MQLHVATNVKVSGGGTGSRLRKWGDLAARSTECWAMQLSLSCKLMLPPQAACAQVTTDAHC